MKFNFDLKFFYFFLFFGSWFDREKRKWLDSGDKKHAPSN